MKKQTDDFSERRLEENRRILDSGFKGFKRFFSLDTSAYLNGALPRRATETSGPVASTVLRCNDCIHYHILQCLGLEITPEEIQEALNVALVVGGSITIPHVRFAFEVLEEEG